MMNRIDDILARQKKQLTLDIVLVSLAILLASLGLFALKFNA